VIKLAVELANKLIESVKDNKLICSV